MTQTPYGWGMDVEEQLRIDKREFDLRTLDDELRVDELCKKVLKRFYLYLLEKGLSPVDATGLANSADYYVRDYVIAIRHRNLFHEQGGIVRQFAGNWYIITTLEPNIRELSAHLNGIMEFYQFLAGKGFISETFLKELELECSDTDYYEGRIESFWGITGDGYTAWERECSLKEQ